MKEALKGIAKNYRVILAVVLLILIAVLMVQNTETVKVKLFLWTVSMPRIVLMMLALITGAICGLVIGRRTGKKK